MVDAHKAAQTAPGGEADIRYEAALLGQFTVRWAEHYRDKQTSPSDYQAGAPLCMDYNGLLEATLVHARNLLEFLMLADDPGTRSAVQFVPGWDPDVVKARRGQLYGDICGLLSHIAVRRPNPPPAWALIDVADTVLREYETFLASATQGNVKLLREGADIARAEIARARTIEAGLGNSVQHIP